MKTFKCYLCEDSIKNIYYAGYYTYCKTCYFDSSFIFYGTYCDICYDRFVFEIYNINDDNNGVCYKCNSRMCDNCFFICIFCDKFYCPKHGIITDLAYGCCIDCINKKDKNKFYKCSLCERYIEYQYDHICLDNFKKNDKFMDIRIITF